MMEGTQSVRLAVLISGGGRTLMNLHENIMAGTLAASIDRVICSRAGAEGVGRARQAGLPTTVVERRSKSENSFQLAITTAIGEPDLVCMAGFLSLWRVPQHMEGRVMNIHPALLPEFGGPGMYGQRVHQAVLDARKKMSGCTVHFCDNQYDHGPIILQRTVPVLPDDTVDVLARRVFVEECIAYPQAIQLFANGQLKMTGNRVEIAGEISTTSQLKRGS